MKLLLSALLVIAVKIKILDRRFLYGSATRRGLGWILILMLLASCSSLGKPELQRSNQAPSCNQRAPALDSGDPPESTDWMAWAQAYVQAQWAIVDRDNKRAATADCLDELARIKP